MGCVLAPSILSADFARLGEEVQAAEAGGAALIHVDVMDGHFVSNLTVGPQVTAAVRRITELPIDCHLMIEEPERYVGRFIDAGAEMVSVHVEVVRHLEGVLRDIQQRGAKAGVVLNPATPMSALDEILPAADFVLLMSVNPGFGGQKLIPSVLDKLRRLRRRVDSERLATRLEIDGGVTLENLDEVVGAGADIAVAGSAVFGAGGARENAARLVRRMAELAQRDARC